MLSRNLAPKKEAPLKPSSDSSTETPVVVQSKQQLLSSNPDLSPSCIHCGQPMQKNTATSTLFVTQYLCACLGTVHFVNVHKGDHTREAKT